MQYLKFQLIKKHTPFLIPPTPPSAVFYPLPACSQIPLATGSAWSVFLKIKIEISGNIYLFAHAFCFTSKLPLMASNTRLQWIWKTASGPLSSTLIVTSHVCSKQNISRGRGGKKNTYFCSRISAAARSVLGWGPTFNTPTTLQSNTEMEQINLALRNALHTFWCCMISNLSANELQPLVMVSAPCGRPASPKSCWLRGKCNTGVKQTW